MAKVVCDAPYKLQVQLGKIGGISVSNYFGGEHESSDNFVFYVKVFAENRLVGITSSKIPKGGALIFQASDDDDDDDDDESDDNNGKTEDDSIYVTKGGVFSNVLVFSPRMAKLTMKLVVSDTTLLEPQDTEVAEFSFNLKGLLESQDDTPLRGNFCKIGTKFLVKGPETYEVTVRLTEDIGLVKISNTNTTDANTVSKKPNDVTANIAGLELNGDEFPPSLIGILKDYETLFEDAIDPYFIDDIVEDASFFLTGTKYNCNIQKGFRGVVPIESYVRCINNLSEDDLSGMIGSFSYDFTSYPRIPSRLPAPMKFLGVELVMQDHSAEGKIFKFIKYYIKVKNKYVMWNLWRWLNIATDFWKQRISEEDLPSWIKSHPDIHIPCSVAISSQGNIDDENINNDGGDDAVNDNNCFVNGSLRKPFQLWQETLTISGVVGNRSITKLSLESLVKVNLALDFPASRSHVIQLKIEGALLNGNPINEPHRESTASTERDSQKEASSSESSAQLSQSKSGSADDYDTQFGPKGNFGFRRGVRKSFHFLGTAIKHVGGNIKDGVVAAPSMASNVLSTVAETVTSTTGKAVRAVTSGDGGLLVGNLMLSLKGASGVMMDLAQKLGTKDFNFVFVKYGPVTHFGVVPFMDNDLHSMTENLITVDVDAGDPRKTDKSKGSDLAFDGRAEVYFFSPVNGIVKSKRFKISNVIPYSGERSYEAKDVSLKLSTSIGVSVTLVRAEGLMAHDKVIGSIHVRTNFANEFGATPKGLAEFRSATFSSSVDVDFNEQNFILTNAEQICHCSYIRLMVVGGNVVQSNTIGYAFIPIEHFSEKEAQREYSLTRYKGVKGTGGRGGAENIGKIFVKIKKIAENVGSEKDKYELKMKSSLRPKSLFNTAWQADAFLQGNFDFLHPEHLNIYASHRFLALFSDNTWHEYARKKYTWRDISEADIVDYAADSSCSDPNSDDLCQDEIVTVAYFENEQRNMLPPFDWPGDGKKNNMCSCTPAQDDVKKAMHLKKLNIFKKKEKGAMRIQDISPPEDYEWIDDEWVSDRFYTKTDAHGWTYGVTLFEIAQNLKVGKSNTNQNLMSARRRRWWRKAKLSSEAMNKKSSMGNIPEENSPVDGVSGGGRSSPSVLQSEVSSDRLTDTFPDTDCNTLDKSASMKQRESSRKYSTGNKGQVLSWREIQYRDNKHLTLRTCYEKKDYDSPVLIPWDRVLSYGQVTSSVFYVHFKIMRYFGSDVYRPANVELFVQNCPAKNLESLFKERILGDTYRNSIYDAIKSRDIYGSQNNFFKENPDLENDMFIRKGILMTKETEIPVSTVLSTGSEAFTRVENHFIERHAGQAFAFERLHVDCRLKLYQYLLFLHELECDHNFTADEVDAVVEADINLSYKIQMKDEVDSANARIEFLLDCTEMRVKDSLVCGFKQLGGPLESSLEILINGYFLEIINIFMTFFSGSSTAVNSLQGKTKLIGTYMRQNDRLQIILDFALKNFKLYTLPRPTLSHFLKLDTLLVWYTDILGTEMKGAVDNTFSAWLQLADKDRQTQVKYKSNIPWFPLREKGEKGFFITQLPEDAMIYLQKYLEYAKLNKDDIAPSFLEKVRKTDISVAASYLDAISYLSKEYSRIIQSTFLVDDYKNIDFEKDFFIIEEKIEWLCASINDCRRVICNEDTKEKFQQMFEVESDQPEVAKGVVVPVSLEEVKVKWEGIKPQFQASAELAVSQFCRLTMIVVTNMADRKINIHDTSYFHEWSKTSQGAEFFSFKEYLDTICSVLDNKIDYIDEACFANVVEECFGRLMTRIMLILSEAYDNKVKFQTKSTELQWLRQDIGEIREAVTSFKLGFMKRSTLRSLQVDSCTYSDCTERVRECVSRIDANIESIEDALTLIDAASDSKELEEAIASVLKAGVDKPVFAHAYAQLLIACMSLRPDHEWSEENHKKFSRLTVQSITGGITNAFRRGSIIISGSSNNSHPGVTTSVFKSAESAIALLRMHAIPFEDTDIVKLNLTPLCVKVFHFLNKEPGYVSTGTGKSLNGFNFSIAELLFGPSEIQLKDKIIHPSKPILSSLLSSASLISTSSTTKKSGGGITNMFSGVFNNEKSTSSSTYVVEKFTGELTDVKEDEEPASAATSALAFLGFHSDSTSDSGAKGGGGVLKSLFGSLGGNDVGGRSGAGDDNDNDNDDDNSIASEDLRPSKDFRDSRDSFANTAMLVEAEKALGHSDVNTHSNSTNYEESDFETRESDLRAAELEENNGHFLRLYDMFIDNHFETDEKCYLLVHYGDWKYVSAHEQAADWRDYDHLKVPVPKLVLTPQELLEGPCAGMGKLMGKLNPTRILHIKIEIFLENTSIFAKFGGKEDELVGTVSLIVDQSDFVSIVDEEYKIDFNNQSAKIKKMLSKLETEDYPVLKMSCFLK